MGKPFPREKLLVTGLQKTVIQKQDCPNIFGCPDYPSGSLQDFIHAGVLVGIRKTGAFFRIKVFFK